MTTRRLFALLLATCVLVIQAAPGLAYTDEPDEPVESVTDEPTSGIQPAVEAPADGADDEEQPWTARFLAPLTLLIGLLALVGALAYYGLRIRGRYRVVE